MHQQTKLSTDISIQAGTTYVYIPHWVRNRVQKVPPTRLPYCIFLLFSSNKIESSVAPDEVDCCPTNADAEINVLGSNPIVTSVGVANVQGGISTAGRKYQPVPVAPVPAQC